MHWKYTRRRRDRLGVVRGEALSVWHRALVLGVACVVMLIAVYALAVHTPAGQLFEDDVLRAADAIAGSTEQADALNILDVLSVPTVVAAILIIFLIGALRRR